MSRVLTPTLSLAAATSLVAGAVLPAAAAPGDLPQAADRTLTVATYNIHHGAGTDSVLDLERIASVLEDGSAELIGLQEVDRHWGERSGFQDQAAWLADRLDMHVCYSANLDHEPAEGRTDRRQYGTAILSEYRLSDCTSTALPNHPGGEQRGLAQADLKVRGVDLTFYNTHLTHNSASGRAEQAQAVNEVLADADGPTILVGDLNAEPSSPEYGLFTALLDDVWPVAGEGPGYTIDPEDPDRRIDYILTSPDITAVSVHVVDTQASDHLPVFAEVMLPHPGQAHRGR